MNQDQDDKDETHEVVLTARKIPRVKSPALWLGFAAVPVALGLLLGFTKGEAVIEPLPPPPKYVPEQRGATRSIKNIPGSIPIIAQAIQAAQDSPQAPQIEAPPQCDFDEWVGMKVEDNMLKAIKDAKRPFRVLPPGSAMTMDHAPARINFDLDNAGNITRVWCG